MSLVISVTFARIGFSLTHILDKITLAFRIYGFKCPDMSQILGFKDLTLLIAINTGLLRNLAFGLNVKTSYSVSYGLPNTFVDFDISSVEAGFNGTHYQQL